MRVYLTKSGFNRGLQCPLAFHNWWNRVPEEYGEAAQARMDEGTEVGILAQQLAPGGFNMNELDLPPWELAARTIPLLQKRRPIYEATFVANSKPKWMCKVDILVPDDKGWQIWEVKATNSVKEEHIPDLAFQTFVLEQCGLHITQTALVHLKRDYRRNGAIDVHQLFAVKNVQEEVRNRMAKLGDELHNMYVIGNKKKAPLVPIGPQCNTPYACAYQYICWKDFPERDSIFAIPRFGAKAAYYLEKGLYTLADIDPDDLSEKQYAVWDAHMHNKTVLDKKAIHAFFKEHRYPYYFLDFETIMPAIPIWDNTGPYMQVPFQYSIHILEKEGAALQHLDFLDSATGADPRPALIEKLISDLGTQGSIWTYNMSFEKKRIEELARAFPRFAKPLYAIYDRIADLMTPFSNQWYYHPDMQGSNSIKRVLPVLVPGLSYDVLDIHDGSMAMDAFLRLVKRDPDVVEQKEQTLNNLKAYCALDTLAMVRILEALLKE